MQSRLHTSHRVFLALLGMVPLVLSTAPNLQAQVVNGGSDGSDGAFTVSGPPGTVVVFDPAQFHGTNVAAHVFNFTTITIPAGVTVKLSSTKINGPVYWLAQGDVTIAGVLDLSGADGVNASQNSFTRASTALPGSGGYAGGVGGNSVQSSTDGSGPGGGGRGILNQHHGLGGTFTGNSVLIPLIGGSGGGGASSSNSATFDGGGGAGGGAILIASSTSILVSGQINANGGVAGRQNVTQFPGGGSGGAIRLVATIITGNGTLRANGGTSEGGVSLGNPGRVRLEAFTNTFTGSIQGTQGQSVPNALLVPTAGSPSARVISIAGVPITANPNTFPDLTINTTSPVDVVIETQRIPTSATIVLTILGEGGTPDTLVTVPQLGNCNASNVCTTTVSVVFAPGASRGLTRVTWTQ